MDTDFGCSKRLSILRSGNRTPFQRIWVTVAMLQQTIYRKHSIIYFLLSFFLSFNATAHSEPWPPHLWGLLRWVISSSQGPLPDNTQHSQQTVIHAPGGIRTHNLNKRATADLRLKPHGHWNRQLVYFTMIWLFYFYTFTCEFVF